MKLENFPILNTCNSLISLITDRLFRKKKIKHVSKERIPTVGEKVRGEKGRRKGVKVDRGENRLEREKTNMPTTNYFFFCS